MIAPVGHVLNLTGLLDAPFDKRAIQTGGNHLRSRKRHNPLRSFPSTDDMIAFRFKFGGVSNPQALTHTRPFDSLPCEPITRPQTFPEDELTLMQVSVVPSSRSAQTGAEAVAPDQASAHSPDTR